VHAPKFALQKVNEARMLADGALAIVNGQARKVSLK